MLGVDCDAKTYSSVGSKGRIIGGQYQCSELFFFDVGNGADHEGGEGLNNLVIHYSSTQRTQTELGAKTMAEALGVEKSKLASLENGLHHEFIWQEEGTENLSGLNMDFNRTGAIWTVTLNFSRFYK